LITFFLYAKPIYDNDKNASVHQEKKTTGVCFLNNFIIQLNYHSYLDKEKSHVITIIIVVIGIKQDRAILPVVTSVDEQSNVNPRLLLEF
jgi:hypothetical protein